LIGVKTPFRVSFAGGSSDIDYYYKKYGGKVISSSINKYMFHFINEYRNKKETLIKYSRTELIKDKREIKHPIVKEISKLYDIKGLDIHSIADIPKGSGLASSSAYTVGLIKGLSYLNNEDLTTEEIAKTACMIEIDKLKEPIGKQDQYAASYGGLNLIKFNKDDTVSVKKIKISKENLLFLSSSFLLVKVGKSRNASKILNKQKENIKDEKVLNNIHEIQRLVDPMFSAFKALDIKTIGEILTYNWELKASLTNLTSNKLLDQTFEDISKIKGFYGGKLLGAGGSGYFLTVGNQAAIRTISNKFETIKFSLDSNGSEVIIDS